MTLITVRGWRFDESGAVFKIVGANNYYLAFASARMRGAVISVAQQMGLNVLRAPAFLDCASALPGAIPEGAWRGVYFQYWNPATNRTEVNTGENGLQRLDHLIADAEQAEIRLILPLVNYWRDFGGMDRYVAWFKAGSRNAFYREPIIREAYKSYVSQVLTRRNTVTGRLYKDEPAILAWELANEPRCDTRDGVEVLLEWVREMSRWIKLHDPNHLLAVGDEGHFAKHGVDCDAFLQVPEIDFGTFHLYPEAWKRRDPVHFGLRWIEQHLAAGKSASKPMLLEEYGMRSTSERNRVYEVWLRSILLQEGAGDLAWMIAATDDETGALYRDYDGFTLYSAADVPSICEHALQMAAGS